MNNLSLAEIERLAILAEECGEVIQAIGKILRHGYDDEYSPGLLNRQQLEIEIGDVLVLVDALAFNKDINAESIKRFKSLKLDRVNRYMHHNIFNKADYE